MDKRKIKGSKKKDNGYKKPEKSSNPVSYHLKCAKTANGLTHFVMYGDVPKKQMPL